MIATIIPIVLEIIVANKPVIVKIATGKKSMTATFKTTLNSIKIKIKNKEKVVPKFLETNLNDLAMLMEKLFFSTTTKGVVNVKKNKNITPRDNIKIKTGKIKLTAFFPKFLSTKDHSVKNDNGFMVPLTADISIIGKSRNMPVEKPCFSFSPL